MMEDIEELFKYCKECARILPVASFYKSKVIKNGTQTYQVLCKECQNKKSTENRKKRGAEWSVKSQAKLYGLDVNLVLDYFTSHDGLCDICREPPNRTGDTRLIIEHDHETGEFRGLVCHKCNVGLGAFRDSVLIMEKAIEYLKKGPIENAT